MAALVEELQTMGETVMVLSEDAVLIKSKSQPGHWHQLTWGARGWDCSCEGYRWRKVCRHIRVANHVTDPTEAWEVEAERLAQRVGEFYATGCCR